VLGHSKELEHDMLIRFTSKSCGICERFSKEWEDVVKKSNKNHVLSVDCDKELNFCLKRNVRSFPSFQLHSKWEGYYPYHGSLDKKALIKFVKSLEPDDCYANKTCTEEFNVWLDSSPDLSLENARKKLIDVNTRYAAFFQNITAEISYIKKLELEKVLYIDKYHNLKNEN
tara:strand:+ start:839 stop:1351 length:513 start_codon:yes stop_codon:yes gene_type:complete